MMIENIKEDIKMYDSSFQESRKIKRFIYLLFTQELHAVLIYRFGHWVSYHLKFPILTYPFKISYFFLRKLSEMIIGVGIWPESEIGPGLKIEHWGGVYVKATIGKNCRISQQVVIGHIGGFKGGGVPSIGDNVYIGAGAKILGDVIIGNNVLVGANAVVLSDIQDYGVAVGIPAKVVKLRSEIGTT